MVMAQIEDALQEGATPLDLIERGFKKATVYRVQKTLLRRAERAMKAAQESKGQQESEAQGEGAVQMTQQVCQSCIERGAKITNLEDKLSAASKLAERLPTLESELATTRAAMHKAQAEAQKDYSLREIIAHCEGGQCAQHSAEWKALKEQIARAAIENMPKELVRQKAKDMKLLPGEILVKLPS
ncbi:MAG: hypothetical protein L0177_19805 [Chloroflexi bacterium]|nr:hypothetical protein [Chloroflexota bacterium]